MLFGRHHKHPITIPPKPVDRWAYTTRGYCSTGCSIEVGMDAAGKAVSARGVSDAPVNQGKLCLKGIFEYELFDSARRGRVPLAHEIVAGCTSAADAGMRRSGRIGAGHRQQAITGYRAFAEVADVHYDNVL